MPPNSAQLLWVFTGVNGRIGREVYWLAWIVVHAVSVAILSATVVVSVDPQTSAVQIDPTTGMMPLIAVISVPFQIVIGVKRLHDLNASGFFAIAIFFPMLNILVTILLGIMPGKPGPNRFGDRADVIPVVPPAGS